MRPLSDRRSILRTVLRCRGLRCAALHGYRRPGGGGQGGSVYGVYAEGPLDLGGSGNQFLGGAPGLRGLGGQGGVPGVASGMEGTDGAFGSTGSCTTSHCN